MMKKFFLFCLFLIGLGWAISNFSGLANQGSYDSIVLDFRESLGEQQIANQVRSLAEKYQVVPALNSEFSQADHVYVVRGDQNLLKSLKKSFGKQTEFIEPNYIYRADEMPDQNSQAALIYHTPYSLPNDPLYGQQWNFRSINLEGAWSETQGEGITVAVIDSGVSRVPDLEQTQLVEGYDFVNDKIDAVDDNGHGTHVAGTIAQSTNNNYGITFGMPG